MEKINNYITKYSYQIEYDPEDKIYIARSAEIPSVLAHGKTQEKALKEIKTALKNILEQMKEDGEKIPEPFNLLKFSGEFRVRMPPEKHRKIAMEANLQGISMNQYVVNKL